MKKKKNKNIFLFYSFLLFIAGCSGGGGSGQQASSNTQSSLADLTSSFSDASSGLNASCISGFEQALQDKLSRREINPQSTFKKDQKICTPDCIEARYIKSEDEFKTSKIGELYDFSGLKKTTSCADDSKDYVALHMGLDCANIAIRLRYKCEQDDSSSGDNQNKPPASGGNTGSKPPDNGTVPSTEKATISYSGKFCYQEKNEWSSSQNTNLLRKKLFIELYYVLDTKDHIPMTAKIHLTDSSGHDLESESGIPQKPASSELNRISFHSFGSVEIKPSSTHTSSFVGSLTNPLSLFLSVEFYNRRINIDDQHFINDLGTMTIQLPSSPKTDCGMGANDQWTTISGSNVTFDFRKAVDTE